MSQKTCCPKRNSDHKHWPRPFPGRLAMLAAVRRNVNPFQFLFGREQAHLCSVEEKIDPSQVLTTCKVWPSNAESFMLTHGIYHMAISKVQGCTLGYPRSHSHAHEPRVKTAAAVRALLLQPQGTLPEKAHLPIDSAGASISTLKFQ